jgi:hypothetical protein
VIAINISVARPLAKPTLLDAATAIRTVILTPKRISTLLETTARGRFLD